MGEMAVVHGHNPGTGSRRMRQGQYMQERIEAKWIDAFAHTFDQVFGVTALLRRQCVDVVGGLELAIGAGIDDRLLLVLRRRRFAHHGHAQGVVQRIAHVVLAGRQRELEALRHALATERVRARE